MKASLLPGTAYARAHSWDHVHYHHEAALARRERRQLREDRRAISEEFLPRPRAPSSPPPKKPSRRVTAGRFSRRLHRNSDSPKKNLQLDGATSTLFQLLTDANKNLESASDALSRSHSPEASSAATLSPQQSPGLACAARSDERIETIAEEQQHDVEQPKDFVELPAYIGKSKRCPPSQRPPPRPTEESSASSVHKQPSIATDDVRNESQSQTDQVSFDDDHTPSSPVEELVSSELVIVGSDRRATRVEGAEFVQHSDSNETDTELLGYVSLSPPLKPVNLVPQEASASADQTRIERVRKDAAQVKEPSSADIKADEKADIASASDIVSSENSKAPSTPINLNAAIRRKQQQEMRANDRGNSRKRRGNDRRLKKNLENISGT